MSIVAVVILFVAAILIAVADGFIKQAAVAGNLNYIAAMQTWWFYGSIFLYLIQILLVLYLFLGQWKLGIAGNVFNIFYSLTTILIGYLFFHENLTPTQTSGILLGLLGVFLMTR